MLKFVLKSGREVTLTAESITEDFEDDVRVVMGLNQNGAAVVIPFDNVDWMEECVHTN